ncbi:GNAT family protein [Chamaesiphon sp. VAR_48_metabat_135_sub]|uniref:GNAT family N-acetyltransferase n=1 Tax=Chamaesiphon sp. VAR_48_metabat_135_sub TaxID=2964699 RepID=UPI00286B9355|nr:GNAT family protein [Chamaesiphon sp. VAR_48_metabat_135_sub]
MSSFEMETVISQDFMIQTARCLLRCPSAADIPSVFSATRFAGFNNGMQWEPPATIDELYEPLREQILDWEAGRTFSFTIADLSSNHLIGRIGIRKTERQNVWNLGFWTHPEHQGQGYMTESLKAVIEFGFERLGATRIDASYALWNKGSQRVLEKSGMQFIRYIPHAFQKKGQWIEANKMEITKQKWLALNCS